jgi:hypothetical protein
MDRQSDPGSHGEERAREGGREGKKERAKGVGRLKSKAAIRALPGLVSSHIHRCIPP